MLANSGLVRLQHCGAFILNLQPLPRRDVFEADNVVGVLSAAEVHLVAADLVDNGPAVLINVTAQVDKLVHLEVHWTAHELLVLAYQEHYVDQADSFVAFFAQKV